MWIMEQLFFIVYFEVAIIFQEQINSNKYLIARSNILNFFKVSSKKSSLGLVKKFDNFMF